MNKYEATEGEEEIGEGEEVTEPVKLVSTWSF